MLPLPTPSHTEIDITDFMYITFLNKIIHFVLHKLLNLQDFTNSTDISVLWVGLATLDPPAASLCPECLGPHSDGGPHLCFTLVALSKCDGLKCLQYTAHRQELNGEIDK